MPISRVAERSFDTAAINDTILHFIKLHLDVKTIEKRNACLA